MDQALGEGTLSMVFINVSKVRWGVTSSKKWVGYLWDSEEQESGGNF